MKKILLLTLLALGNASLAGAQAKLDLVSRARLRAERLAQAGNTKDSAFAKRMKIMKIQTGTPENCTLGFIKLKDAAAAAELEAEGVTILRRRGDIAIAQMKTSDVSRLAKLDCVRTMQLSRPVKAKMDVARKTSGADYAHTGDGLPQAYTGKGVITGIVDGGMDPNHINFRREDGSCRVAYLGHLRLNSSGSQLLETYYDANTVKGFTTDDNTSYHGTHTMGIMAGGYRGNVTAAQHDGNTVTIAQKPNPYYGVAYDSDIAASCGTLVDAAIAMGVDNILQYAYDNGRRAVINLSLGSNVGAHDGSDMIHQYMDAVVKQDNAIICVSAGNEGDIPIALNGTFSDTRKEIKTFIRPYVYSDMRYGNLVIYSNDETEFEVQAVIYNKSRGRVSFRMPVSTNTNGVPQYWVSSADYQQDSSDQISANVATAFDGYIGIGSMTDENTGRYYAMIDYYTVDSEKNSDGNYILGFVVTGKDGQRIDCFCDGAFTAFDNYGYEDWDNGMFNGTISDMACGRNTLVVGSYNTKDEYASLDGGIYSYQGNFQPGMMTSFTSYGTLIDGRNLPHVCAPGATIVSSSNTYYVEYAGNGIGEPQLQAKATEDGRNNYWQQMIGTSMATPYVTGAIALWLEADPTLTIDDVKDIVAATSIKDEYVETTGDPVQWGAGKFDAYGGLKEVIRRKEGTAISETCAKDSRLMLKQNGDRLYNVFLGGAKNLDITLCSLSGMTVARQTATGDEADFDASGITPGIYIMNVNGRHSQRIVIR
ncbi:MAG: S8 family peptidase [Bacteroidales bacterium]|nr:S8 family peptidase [Bacteroidales bacterium]MCM1148104.1 S8 family peptidase [Bacteroidales bacterium]MCM1206520.1 S8 family peptidase [Bacillota bacterium]MCM1510578.1 S8 family peptidase [Clostridium sp.]